MIDIAVTNYLLFENSCPIQHYFKHYKISHYKNVSQRGNNKECQKQEWGADI